MNEFTKEMKDLYIENHKTLMKEIKEDTNKWKDIPCLWIRRLYIIKCPQDPKQSADSVQPLSKFQWHFHRKKTNQPKICM